jgi:hypothetical protein
MDKHNDELGRERTPGGMDAAVVDIWTFRLAEGLGDIDIAGYSVEATDGGIGKVDESTYEIGGSYLVVDTGPWIFGKKVLLPAGLIDRVDPESEQVFVARTKEEIKNAPEYDEERGFADEEYRGRLGGYYGTDR